MIVSANASLEMRADFKIIAEIIQPGTRVLDLGCGEGLLLAWLAAGVRKARDVAAVAEAVARALARIEDASATTVDPLVSSI